MNERFNDFFEQDSNLRKKYQIISEEIRKLECIREELVSEKIRLMEDKKIFTIPYAKNILLNSQTLFQNNLITIDMENVTFVRDTAFVVLKKGEQELLCALRRNSNNNYELFTIFVITKGRRLGGRFYKNNDFQFLSDDSIITRSFSYNPYKNSGHGREFQEEYCIYTLKDYYVSGEQLNDSGENVRCENYKGWIAHEELSVENGRNLWRSTDSYKAMIEEMENNKRDNSKRKTGPSLSIEEKEHNKVLRRKIRGL